MEPASVINPFTEVILLIVVRHSGRLLDSSSIKDDVQGGFRVMYQFQGQFTQGVIVPLVKSFMSVCFG